MQRVSAAFTPLNAYRTSLTVPSSHFTLEPVSISPANKPENQASKASSLTGSGIASITPTTMPIRGLWDCFEGHKKSHFQAADELFEQGVWIGYFAEQSRNTRYRQLPSYRDLEKNYAELSFPYPEPLQFSSSCSNRTAVCRGCFADSSSVLQLREVRFGPHHKVVVMPLQGADEAGLFCIMLPQPLDRSMKALESFRPYEHGIGRDNTKPFSNDFMLLASRDRENGSDVVDAVRYALDPAELERIANRSSSPKLSAQPTQRSAPNKTTQSDVQTRFKRKQTQTNGGDSTSGSSVKRSRQKAFKGPRMSEQGFFSLSGDDMDSVSIVPSSRSLSSMPRVQQQVPVLPSDAVNPSPSTSLDPSPSTALDTALNNVPSPVVSQEPLTPIVSINILYFTDEEARRIRFIWSVDLGGTDTELTLCLTAYSTLRSLLDSFQEETELVPSVAQQFSAKLWLLSYKLANGPGKSAIVKPSSPDFEHGFDGILRSLAERDEWKKDKTFIVNIEMKPMMSGRSE